MKCEQCTPDAEMIIILFVTFIHCVNDDHAIYNVFSVDWNI